MDPARMALWPEIEPARPGWCTRCGIRVRRYALRPKDDASIEARGIQAIVHIEAERNHFESAGGSESAFLDSRKGRESGSVFREISGYGAEQHRSHADGPHHGAGTGRVERDSFDLGDAVCSFRRD